MRCPKCGNEIPDHAFFCSFCGYKIQYMNVDFNPEKEAREEGKRIVRRLVSSLCSIALFVILCILAITFALKNTVFDEEFVMECVDDSDIIEKVKEELSKKIDNYLEEDAETGIENAMIENAESYVNDPDDIYRYLRSAEGRSQVEDIKYEVGDFLYELNNEKNIKEIAECIVEELYEEDRIAFDKGKLNKKCEELIDDMVDSSGYDYNYHTLEEIERYKEKAIVNFNKLTLKELDHDYLNSALDEVKNPIPDVIDGVDKVMVVLLLVGLALSAMILLLYRKKLSSGINYIAITMLIAGILISVLSALTGNIDEMISREADAEVARDIIEAVVERLDESTGLLGHVYIAVAVGVLILKIVLKTTLKKRMSAKKY